MSRCRCFRKALLSEVSFAGHTPRKLHSGLSCDGTAELKCVVDKVFPFEQAKEALLHLAAQQHVGKVVIQVVKE